MRFFSSLVCYALFRSRKFCGTFFISAIDFCLQDSNRYDRALEYIDSGDYEAAYILLDELSYKDSGDKLQSIKFKYRQQQMKKANVGDTVFFGAYEQDNDVDNGQEDIEWLVLAKEDNKIFVISEKALDSEPYNTLYANVTWESCSLRQWLNSSFLTAAFSPEEQAHIQSTSVSADNNPDFSTDPGNTTTDKLFLLSISEANKYFSSDEARKCLPTVYAGADDADLSSSDTEDSAAARGWWLRSPGMEQRFAAAVYSDGTFDYYTGAPVSMDFSIRPALWISLE